MKKNLSLCLLLIMSILSCQEIYAQQQVLSYKGENIHIEAILDYIEKNTTYKIFSYIDEPLTVSIDVTNLSPIQLLEVALRETSYKISPYHNWIFILKGGELFTTFSASLLSGNKSDSTETSTIFKRKEKATSENKLYTIGDPYHKGSPEYAELSGQITDFKTGEPISGAHIILKSPWTATTTNAEGHFTITLPVGKQQIEISGMNIKDTRRQLMLYNSGILDIELEEEEHILDEVTVLSNRIQQVKTTQLGMERLQISRIKNIPTALGEVDVLKAIQALPGVKTVGEASTGYNVRGGSTDQNLLLLNDGTIYNSSHLFGFFTAFSSDMVKEADMYKSSIPVKYGGRISSVLDITAREASKEKFSGAAGIGLVTSKLNLEIPLIKEKTSLLLSGRTTYSDWILGQLPEKSGYSDGRAGFYDLGANLSHQIDDKNLLTVFGYYSYDRFAFTKNDKYNYTNMNFSAKWRSIFGEKLIAYFAAGYDHYDYANMEKEDVVTAFKLSFNIEQFYAKADFNYNFAEKHKLDFGFKSMLYNINSGKYEPVGNESMVKEDALQKDKALETAFYLGDQWDITRELSVSAGIRYSIFNALGPRTYFRYSSHLLPSEENIIDTVQVSSGKVLKTYHAPEFRLSARYAFNDNFSIKAGFNTMRQYIHKLSNSALMSPTDTWKLSDANIRPQSGWQAALGSYYNTPNNLWEFSAEVYYKKMNDYLDYKSGAQLLMNHHIETDVIRTKGRAYGAELSVRKMYGKLNGWASYTYSRTFLKQDNKLIEKPVNNGNWYSTEYDKPHEFKFVGNYKFTQRYSVSVNVDYSTGRPITVPIGKYFDSESGVTHVYYSDRNTYRVKDYFRTDISFNIEPSHRLTLLTHSSISFGVYNVTGRKNVHSVYFRTENGEIKGYQMSIFGVPIPFVTYNIKF